MKVLLDLRYTAIMDKRVTPGKYVSSTTRTYTAFHCDTCGDERTVATCKAPDGSEGCFCTQCKAKGVKSPGRWIEVPDVDWVPGKVEVRCCGVWLECDHFTNTCECCGADYNHTGQRLAPREQWGEETGETATDVLGL